LLEHFKGFIGYTEEEFKDLWEKAIFAVDTNILINFYKYTSKQSTKSLLDILKKLKESNRLWIPHQVALEYFFNYEENMYKQNEGYELLGKELQKLKEDANKALSTVKSKHPYIMTDKFQFFIDKMEQSNRELQEQIEVEISNLPDSNTIQKELLDLLDGIIGESYTQEKINAIEKEGKDRYQHDIPPGFKDKNDNNKQGFRTYGDFRYQQLYGDLIVWFQIIDKAKVEGNPAPIILITEDRKEDWWEKDGQKIKRPHPQLIQEFLNKTQQKFYMYRTENFIRNAMEYLGAKISEEQYQEVTKDIEQIRKSEENVETVEVRQNETNGKINRNIDVSRLLRFLPTENKEIFRDRIEQVFEFGDNSLVSNTEYNNVIKWGVIQSIPRLERRVKNLASDIALRDYNKAQKYISKLESLPKDSIERGILLLEVLDEMEREQQEYMLREELPF
jgi:hypothetical protein